MDAFQIAKTIKLSRKGGSLPIISWYLAIFARSFTYHSNEENEKKKICKHCTFILWLPHNSQTLCTLNVTQNFRCSAIDIFYFMHTTKCLPNKPIVSSDIAKNGNDFLNFPIVIMFIDFFTSNKITDCIFHLKIWKFFLIWFSLS